MDTLHEATIHQGKRKQKEELAQQMRSADAARLRCFNNKYSDLETGNLFIEGSGAKLRISLWCTDDDEAALLVPKLVKLLEENKADLRKQQQILRTYKDIYDSVT